MRLLKTSALFLASAGTAFVWLAPYLLAGFPAWVSARYYLLICAPAAALGCFAYGRHSGFARSPSLVACLLLMLAGILWTDETEFGRSLLLTAACLLTLPIAALINERKWQTQFARVFGYATVATMIIAAPHVSASLRWGTILDRTSTPITNPDTVGLQAGLAAVLLTVSGPRTMRPVGLYLPVAFLLVVLIMSATLTALVAAVAGLFLALIWRARQDLHGVLTILVPLVLAVVPMLLFNTTFLPESIYRRLGDRFTSTDEATVASLEARKLMVYYGMERLFERHDWVIGFGTGGPDKILGESLEFRSAAIGRDGVRRVYCHNTFLWWTTSFGLLGVVVCGWLAANVVRSALRLDVIERSWTRVAVLSYVTLGGMGGVINQEPFWIAVGALLWAMLSVSGNVTGREAHGVGQLKAKQLAQYELPLRLHFGRSASLAGATGKLLPI